MIVLSIFLIDSRNIPVRKSPFQWQYLASESKMQRKIHTKQKLDEKFLFSVNLA